MLFPLVQGESLGSADRDACFPRTSTGSAPRGSASGGRDDVERLGDVVKFHWEAVAKDGELFAVGLHFLVLAADGRIERDYTFVGA